MAELRRIRSIKTQELERSGSRILEAVRRGAENPVNEAVSTSPNARFRTRAKPLVRLLDAWLQARAARVKISPTIVASKEQLKSLAEGYLQGELPDVPILSGWRRQIVGQELLDILTGKLHLRVQPETGRLLAEESPTPPNPEA
jgi:ribonuclease D